MRKFIAFISLLALAMVLATSATHAAQPVKKYKSCSALWKKYPAGVASLNYFADEAVSGGFLRPTIARSTYFDNLRLVKDSVICAKRSPNTAPTEPILGSVWASPQGLSISMFWTKPTQTGWPPIVYDVYLNGALFNQGITTTSYTFTSLAPETTYAVGVSARNTAGQSPVVTKTVTTISQEQADNPGRVKVTYTATGLVDVTISAPGGTQQFSNVTNPSYIFWFRPSDFIYISAQNQNNSGDVSCNITSSGRNVASNSSSGAYVIATCKGQAS